MLFSRMEELLPCRYAIHPKSVSGLKNSVSVPNFAPSSHWERNEELLRGYERKAHGEGKEKGRYGMKDERKFKEVIRTIKGAEKHYTHL